MSESTEERNLIRFEGEFGGDIWIRPDHERTPPKENAQDGLSLHSFGYVSPTQVGAYVPAEGEEKIVGVPKQSVRIKHPSRWVNSVAGEYYFYHEDASGEEQLIIGGTVLVEDIEEGKIDPRYVVQDLSGRVFPITREKINGVLIKAYESAEGGIPGSNLIGDLELMAEASGLDCKAQIRELKGFMHERYLERYSAPDNLVTKIQNLESACGCSLILKDDSGELLNPYLGEVWEFIGLLPEIEIPQDLRKRTQEALWNYMEMCDGAKRELMDELEEKKVKVGDDIEDIEAERLRVIGLANSLRDK